MIYQADDRAAEIEEGLRDLLAELGLTTRLDDLFGCPIIKFSSTSTGRESVVKVVLKGPAGTGEGLSWADSRIEITEIEAERVGDNGWTSLWVGSTSRRGLAKDAAQALEQIGQALRDHPVMPDWDGPLVARDPHFVTAYEHIKSVLDDYGGTDLLCERVDGVERYMFNDHRGRTWHIAYKDGKAVVSVDDVFAESFPANSPVELAVYIDEVMFDVPRP